MLKNAKEKFAESLRKLLGKKMLDHITIKDIVEDCGVSRQTFYYYFTDIYQIVEWVYTNLVSEALNNNRSFDTWIYSCELFYKIDEIACITLPAFFSFPLRPGPPAQVCHRHNQKSRDRRNRNGSALACSCHRRPVPGGIRLCTNCASGIPDTPAPLPPTP